MTVTVEEDQINTPICSPGAFIRQYNKIGDGGGGCYRGVKEGKERGKSHLSFDVYRYESLTGLVFISNLFSIPAL